MKHKDWHAGFVAAMKLELRAYSKQLVYEEEHSLANRAQRLDLLIIKNDRRTKIRLEIGAIFDKYNIVEYKSPDDTLDLGDFYKTISHTCLYLQELHEYDIYGRDAFTVTLIREKEPADLLRQLSRDGLSYNETSPGVIVLKEKIPFAVQIIITGRLPEQYHWLKKLTKTANKEDVRDIVCCTEKLNKKYKDYATALMNVFADANEDVVRTVKEESATMTDAIRRLFADEIKEKDQLLSEKDQEIKKLQEEISQQGEVITQLKSSIDSLREDMKKLVSKTAML